MPNKKSLLIFDQKEIRRHWDEDKELWYFSVIDVVAVLTDSTIPKRYWTDLKSKLIGEGSETYEKIVQLKMTAPDGKMRLTDVADTQTLFRLIQSIPSPKAEPFKLWLAQVGYQRVEEIEDPELAFDRAIETYIKKGYTKQWINQRLKSIDIRKELTDEWREGGITKQEEFAILTDEITKAWSDKSVKEYKQHKGLHKESLRDNMTNLEIVLNMLAETTTAEISKVKKPKGLSKNKAVAKEGGTVAKIAKLEIEKRIGKDVISEEKNNKLI